MNVLPCPFCGSNVKLEMPKLSVWTIECPGCHAGMVRRGFDETKRERERALAQLLNRWNKRTAQQSVEPTIDGLGEEPKEDITNPYK